MFVPTAKTCLERSAAPLQLEDKETIAGRTHGNTPPGAHVRAQALEESKGHCRSVAPCTVH